MNEIDRAVPTVDLEYLELTRLTADDDEAAGDGLVHLHDASNIILATLQVDLADALVPVLARPINARKVLVDDALAAIECLPHGDVAMSVPGDHEVVDFTQAVYRVVLINVRNVPIVEGVLDRLQQVDGLVVRA